MKVCVARYRMAGGADMLEEVSMENVPKKKF
jgi:hypothetical protein